MKFFSIPGRCVCWVFNERGFVANIRRVLLILVASALLVWIFDPVVSAKFDFGLLWRNAMPVAFLLALIYGLSGRFLFSLVAGISAVWAVFAINGIKEQNLHSPLMPGDLVLWRQTITNVGFFAHYVGHQLIVLVLVMLFAVGAVALLLYVEKRWQRPRWGSRAGWCLMSAALLFTLFHGDGWWAAAYGFDEFPEFRIWDEADSVNYTGVMAGLVRMTQLKRTSIPPPDKSLVSRFMQDHADELRVRATRKPPELLPDIVVVQSEAFFDPQIMKSIEPGDYVPNFERLAATGISGGLLAPTYGGGTIRTEFEVETGYPMNAFPDVEFPYFGLAASWMPTVAHRLASLGYSTQLFHPFNKDFWNRSLVMPELGFQHSHYEEDFAGAARAGGYISDRALYEVVLANLAGQRTQPAFIRAITMENHGPWENDAVLPGMLDGKILPKRLSVRGKQEMNYYLSHLVNGDAALGDFAKSLMARQRWTILVFYGDHLPSLDSAFADIGFDDNRDGYKESTRYMLLSNRPFAADAPRKLDLNAYDLPGLLFDTIGLPEDGYLAVASEIREVRMHDANKDDPKYSTLQFNAAALEVRCHSKLATNGECVGQMSQRAAPLATH